MDAVKQSRRRSNGKLESTPPVIRQCRYCKGKFEVDPQFPHKQFCKEAHRKLHWKYGSQSIGKVAERIERDVRKLIAAELRPILCEMVRILARLDAIEEGVTEVRGEASRLNAREIIRSNGGAGV